MTAAETLEVSLGARSYPIHLGRGILERAGELLAPLFRVRRCPLVYDARLADTPHPERLRRALATAGIRLDEFPVPPGESSKSFETLEELVEALLAKGIERHSTLLALGGGVVGDLAGFAAAITLRGVDFVQIPTTLLAQVDSAVGGKTGINTRQGKNLVGAFKQPRAVLVDLDTLDTLPPRELRAGYAEIVKYGCIHDAAFFDWLVEHGRALLTGRVEARIHAIRRSLEIKADIVAQDECEETDLRALLNFGHTFAHAFEALAGYDGRLRHGEAVAIGMVAAAELSSRLRLAPSTDRLRLERHLAACDLPTRPAETGLFFAPEAALRVMERDKKRRAGKIRFVLWRGIGRAFVAEEVPLDAVQRTLEWLEVPR